MASSSPLTDLTENFFLCSVCLDQFEEPKLLPCLHRYCIGCLDKIIQASNDGTLKCPVCKQICDISKDGVNGFKTDFHMKSILEFIQLQKSFENRDLKQCGSCGKKLKMSVYCFKCREFLCDQCCQFHKNNRLFKDHKQHILKLENYENQNLLLERLATLTENPRCHHHVEQEAQLCCSTCGNLPVCLTCVYGKHKGHDLYDVPEEAERQRKSLEMKLSDVNKHKDKLYEIPNIIDKSIHRLKENVTNESEKIRLQYEQQVEKVKETMEQRKAERDGINKSIRTNREKELNEIRKKYEEEMKQIVEKYDLKSKNVVKKHDQSMKELERKLEQLSSDFKELTREKDTKTKHREIELQKISEYCEQLIKRYENLTATTSSILASNDKWTDTQCIPDITAASELLIAEMKKLFSEMESLSSVKFDNLNNVSVDVAAVKDECMSVVDVEGFKTNGFCVNNVTNVSDGNMALAGGASRGYSHITVIDRDGKIQRQDKMKPVDGCRLARYCCTLSEFEVATASWPHEVGIYDVRDGSYKSQNIKKIISKCDMISCVTTDSVKDHIIVGTRAREVHVFDHQLNYIKTIQLPDVAFYPLYISVHEGNLLVCSYIGSAYVVKLEGSSSQVMCEFNKPDLYGGNWRPFTACTDKNGSIYMLWVATISGHERRILVQYSKDTRHILKQISIDNNSACVTTVEQDDAEELVIATYNTGMLYTYTISVN